MNDNDPITAVQESFADVHMTVPAQAVVHRGRMLRGRPRMRGLTGAVALIGGAAAALAFLVPGGRVATAQLAAWTVRARRYRTRLPGSCRSAWHHDHVRAMRTAMSSAGLGASAASRVGPRRGRNRGGVRRLSAGRRAGSSPRG